MSTAASTAPALLAQILHPLDRYVAHLHGETKAVELLRRASLSPEILGDARRWVPLEQAERYMALVFDLVDRDEEVFKEACGYRMLDGPYAKLRVLLWAATPALVYAMAFRHVRAISAFGDFRPVSGSEHELRARYTTDLVESRLMCLLRRGQGAMLPALWGLPPARIDEEGCVAYGDPACNYHYRWHVRTRPLAVLVALGLGLGAAGAALPLGVHGVPLWSLAVLGLASAAALELRRSNGANTRTGQAQQAEAQRDALDAAAARREAIESRQREAQWTGLMRERLEEGRATIAAIASRLKVRDDSTQAEIRGYSHDIRSPLTALRSALYLLRTSTTDAAVTPSLREAEEAVEEIDALLRALMKLTTTTTPASTQLERVSVSELALTLQQRAAALVYGRRVVTRACVASAAPSDILVDRLFLDHVTDQVLERAASSASVEEIRIDIAGDQQDVTLAVRHRGDGSGGEPPLLGGLAAAMLAHHGRVDSAPIEDGWVVTLALPRLAPTLSD